MEALQEGRFVCLYVCLFVGGLFAYLFVCLFTGQWQSWQELHIDIGSQKVHPYYAAIALH